MPSLPSPGQLRHPLVIEGISGTIRDAFGASTPIWTAVATRWAKKEITGGEGISINQANTRATLSHLRLTFRRLPGLNVNQRIRLGNIPAADYSTLTADELIALLAAAEAVMTAYPGKPPHIYTIAAIIELDDKRAWHQVTAVEVASG